MFGTNPFATALLAGPEWWHAPFLPPFQALITPDPYLASWQSPGTPDPQLASWWSSPGGAP